MKAAAAYVAERDDLAATATQRAVLAVQLHDVFLDDVDDPEARRETAGVAAAGPQPALTATNGGGPTIAIPPVSIATSRIVGEVDLVGTVVGEGLAGAAVERLAGRPGRLQGEQANRVRQHDEGVGRAPLA